MDLCKDYLTTNKATWNARTDIHVASKFYDIDNFLQGASSLTEIETAELGDVNGKRLLHLQCHFGLDSLSFARKGALVTGVDLSDKAIDKANALAAETQLNAKFVCQDVCALGQTTTADFDIVFTSFGVICWLPNLSLWAQTIANSLTSGGTFYMAEFHPFHDVFEGYPYFHRQQPDVEQEGTYTENCTNEKHTIITWAHPISDVINALLSAGLQLKHFNEFDYSPYNCFAGLTQDKRHATPRYQLIKNDIPMPLVYSLSAIKP
ncbi:class I SAM-dependent methyltransferase [Shewanella subflava]|uniref:Class I SAM-dependent methyltransferase n=1 Tax=Shewanella subflava TaxID=2986476 RepID=A0ABT3ICX0_9GAMM|nr:class I SAM-dependent methyltransferase [Shewanella subflava]MCW3173739.1 class I SAM-dependent methyltransferase [Shewanella subflava]